MNENNNTLLFDTGTGGTAANWLTNGSTTAASAGCSRVDMLADLKKPAPVRNVIQRQYYSLITEESGGKSQLWIDGEITSGSSGWDWWTDDRLIGEKTFREDLARCGDVDVFINSPGGDVFAGMSMYTALKMHPHKVTVKITGIAASIASVIAMAGDEILISPVGYMMIHDPWTVVVGNARDMEHEAQVLREIGEGILEAYRRTGLSDRELSDLLEAETYLNAKSAVDKHFADGILLFDRDLTEAVKENQARASLMRGRDYAPAAYMARLGKSSNASPSGGGAERSEAERAQVRSALAIAREAAKNLKE